MASVMFGASLVTVAITLAIRPAMRRASQATRTLAQSDEFATGDLAAEELLVQERIA
jgi:hypothetical protein